MNTSSNSNNQAGQRYQQMFARLDADNQGAFIPFVTLGDPDAGQSLAIIKTLVDAGADALELGIPFSDPSADGVTIQKAALRALHAGTTTDTCLELLAKVRAYAPDIPIGLLLYGNLVFARGIERFYQDVADAGVDSVLIADLPIRECQRFHDAALRHGVAPIFIAPPNASDSSLAQIAHYSHGYTYVLSRAGVTGTETRASTPAEHLISALKQFNAPPAVIGFGISQPEEVRAAIKSGASGAISGSAVVRIIESQLAQPQQMLSDLAAFVSAMKAATKNNK